MKTFFRKTTVRCICGSDVVTYIKGAIYENGKIKKVIREPWICGTCGNNEPIMTLSYEAIEKVEKEAETIMTKLYDIVETKEIEGKEWCKIEWRGFWEENGLKSLMSSIFNDFPELTGKVAFSYETKSWYVQKEIIADFDKAISNFSEYLQPKGGLPVEKLNALDDAFKK